VAAPPPLLAACRGAWPTSAMSSRTTHPCMPPATEEEQPQSTLTTSSPSPRPLRAIWSAIGGLRLPLELASSSGYFSGSVDSDAAVLPNHAPLHAASNGGGAATVNPYNLISFPAPDQLRPAYLPCVRSGARSVDCASLSSWRAVRGTFRGRSASCCSSSSSPTSAMSSRTTHPCMPPATEEEQPQSTWVGCVMQLTHSLSVSKDMPLVCVEKRRPPDLKR
jgi:hypothetical protein